MKTQSLLLILLLAISLFNCNNNPDNLEDAALDTITKIESTDSIMLSFAFMGCNRVDRHDIDNTNATDSSSANLVVLERVMREVMQEEHQPDLFFFLGDIVLAETTTSRLNYELDHWVRLYNDTAKTGPMSASNGIEVIAVPGNHEMLFYDEYPYNPKYPNDTLHTEWPLEGSTALWMKYMKGFMPADRDQIGGADSINNQMTFSFVRGNVGFIMMNTDTYNEPNETYPHGIEGMIAYDWIANKTEEYHKDPSIDHIFVMGHKPAYTSSETDTTLHFDTIHAGFMHSQKLWADLMEDTVMAMLSAHAHTYSRNQPEGHGTYQVIAGNAGSKDPAFYGYTLINVYASGDVKLVSKGFDNNGKHYYDPASASEGNMTSERDTTTLIWSKNATSYRATYRP